MQGHRKSVRKNKKCEECYSQQPLLGKYANVVEYRQST